MKKRFLAIVNDHQQFHLAEEDAIVFEKVEGNQIRGAEGNRAVGGEMIAADFAQKKYRIRINGGLFDITFKNDLDLLIDELGLAANVTSVSNELKAPMPGLIVDVLVKPGSAIKAGDGLLVLEAMKMENKLTAAHDGIVKSVLVKPTDAVEKGTVLIEFENNAEDK